MVRYSHMATALAALLVSSWTLTARADAGSEYDAASEVYSPPGVSSVSPSAIVQTNPYAPRRDVITRQIVEPNGALIASGVVMFGAAYGASVVVASQSNNPADSRLYIPVAGPWMDLAARPNCPSTLQIACRNETTNKVMLVADGVFQGLGALQMLGGLLFPETRTIVVSRTVAKDVHIAPTGGAGGVGMMAYGKF